MLEDELREVFAAAVRTPPAVSGPADRAIRKGRGMARRRRVLTVLTGLTVFVAALGGAAGIRWGESGQYDDGRISFQGLYGPALGGVEKPGVLESALPAMKMPVDVRVGDRLYAVDGSQVWLTSAGDVERVIRVPLGWVYSDSRQVVRLATVEGPNRELLATQTSWEVDASGSTLGSTLSGTVRVELVQRPAGYDEAGKPIGEGGALSTPAPAEAELIGVVEDKALLRRKGQVAFDVWTVGRQAYSQNWNKELKAVFGNGHAPVFGLADGPSGLTCLVEVIMLTDGLQAGRQLGCDEMFDAGDGRVAVSPDSRWLSVGTPTGVHLVDLTLSREQASKTINGTSPLIITTTCAATATSPIVWADRRTVVVVSQEHGVVACRTDGSRQSVELPAGVTSGWELVPAVASMIDD
jgi:hypothetical protein